MGIYKKYVTNHYQILTQVAGSFVYITYKVRDIRNVEIQAKNECRTHNVNQAVFIQTSFILLCETIN